jgi:hypothetical protein
MPYNEMVSSLIWQVGKTILVVWFFPRFIGTSGEGSGGHEFYGTS